jgi:hypothetical protein
MARQESVTSVTLEAGEDLSAAQYTFVDAPAGLATRVAATTDRTVGVLLNAPTLGQAAEVAISGVVKVRSGEAVAIGGVVKADATGRATDAAIATTEIELGIALSASGAADELVEVLLGAGVRGGIA